jgi:hypothetical protein
VERGLGKKYGYRVNFKHVVISGICEECTRKNI